MKAAHHIYLDNHATTQVDPRVVEAMLPYFTEFYGNPASRQHEFGWRAEAGVRKARRQVATLIHAEENEIVFTSGATESINLALKGVAEGYRARGRHIVTVVTEHQAVLGTCETLERSGFKVTRLAVDRRGRVSLDDLERAITNETILVSVMAANNEIGTIAPIGAIGKLCRERGILFHTDAAQAAGKIPIDVRSMDVDLLSFTSHKIYGPKGIGALFIRRNGSRIPLVPQIEGGGHEEGLRSGTLNVPGIVGFGEAAGVASTEMHEETGRIAQLRDMLVDGLISRVENAKQNGDDSNRLAGNASITFGGTRADKLIVEMKEVAVSTGSACSSAIPKPSHVLRAIGLSAEDSLCSIRFGIGRFNTNEEIKYTINKVAEIVGQIRKTSQTHHLALS